MRAIKSEITNLLEIVGLAYRHAGLFVETTTVISKKLADLEEDNAVKDLADALKTQASVMESKIVVLQRELKKAQKNTNKPEVAEESANATLSSDVNTAKEQPQAELDRQDEKKVQEILTEDDAAASMETSAPAADEQAETEVEEEEDTPSLTTEIHKQVFADVLEDELEAATFPKAVDRTVFTRALHDIAGHDATLRMDAAKALAEIRHELSVRVLANQMNREHSAKVRLECVRSLATLRMNEGITAVETAMNDQAAQVRLAAVWSLYQLAGAECVPALIRTFSDEDGEVRRRAITCIGWLAREKKTVGMTENSDSRLAASALVRSLQDPEGAVRTAALGALEAVTGTRMSKQPATDDKDSHQDIIEQWEKWWRQELLG